jgi:hypothetical protein
VVVVAFFYFFLMVELFFMFHQRMFDFTTVHIVDLHNFEVDLIVEVLLILVEEELFLQWFFLLGPIFIPLPVHKLAFGFLVCYGEVEDD